MFKLWRLCFVCSLLIHSHFAAISGKHGAVLRMRRGALNKAFSGHMEGGSSQKAGSRVLLDELIDGLISSFLGGGSLLDNILNSLLGNQKVPGDILNGPLGNGQIHGDLLKILLGGGGISSGGGLLNGVLRYVVGRAGGSIGGGSDSSKIGLIPNGGLLGESSGGSGILGSLLGGGDLLGIGGLLTTLQGIIRLQLVDLTIPKISLNLLPGIGVHLNLYTTVTINGKSILGLLDSLVEVNITAKGRFIQEASGVTRLVIEDCNALPGQINIRQLSGLASGILDGLVTNLLQKVIPEVLCPIVNVVLNLINGLLLTVNSVVPFGLTSSIQYAVSSLPIVSTQFIQLDINTVVGQLGSRGIIEYTLDKSNAPITLPPMMDATECQLGLSTYFFGNVLTALQKEGLMDIEITNGDVPGMPPLTTTVLGSIIPKVALMYKDVRPLVLKTKVPSAPVVKLQKNHGIVTLFLKTEIFASNTNSTLTSLCVLGVDVRLNAHFTASGNKLIITLSLESARASLLSSSVGSFEASALEGIVGNLIGKALLPVLNTVVGQGIPLPHLMHLDYDDATIDILDDLVVLTTSS